MELEKRGIPTVTLCTDEFLQLGRSEAASLGMPALPLAQVPHPLGGQTREQVLSKAEAALEQVRKLLTAAAGA
ncbi:MAG: hypothetical protein KatS3mg131_1329 [Candidatus Tectimicrobiota bacterium]|nr:MAG: hypothetical protein KatS3mg131_1329 [Candidatus Tectomicrobia bacterium]